MMRKSDGTLIASMPPVFLVWGKYPPVWKVGIRQVGNVYRLGMGNNTVM